MKKLIITILLVNILFFALPISYAADSTPSADIKAKLEELKKEIASKASMLKQEITKKLSDKAYIGKVATTNSNTSFALTTATGVKTVKLNQDTKFESNVKGKSKFSGKNIASNDYIAALGDIDDTEVLIARKIILLPPPPSPKIALWGQIVSVSDKLTTLKDKDLKSHAVSISNSTVKLNSFVILTGTIGKNDIFQSEFVHTIPQGMILKPKKVATPSAKIASPSAKPTIKK